MFSYFTSNADADIQYPIKKYFKWNIIKKMYSQELERLKDYYRGREYNYNNNNMLIKLIKTLARDHHLPVLEYLSYVDTDARYVSSQFDIVSNRHSGKVLQNILFEGRSNEIFLYTDNAVDPATFEKDWKTYESIRVIKTDIANANYPLLFRYEKYSPGVTIFEIDIKALMLQYYYWCNERKMADRDIAANVFLPTIVIPNISNSLVDYCIWNRFCAIANNEPIADMPQEHPIHLIDYSKGIDDVLRNVVKDNTNTSIYITQLLRTIPSIIADNAQDALLITNSYYNKQSKWVLLLSRLDDIITLHKLVGERGARVNKPLFGKMPYEVKSMSRDTAIYESKLDSYTLVVIDECLKYIKNNIGKR